ncbi:transporter substrate-binding domain-containing protein [Allobaculum stercoricanis]|uniref:transporter substrate-binding domain-containing protein n=1 Tax=Allobaculum stercoricanis TaxID=174709 RepID=UPI00037EF9DF|nr:transporter substrate-binding domain-containing protein [Allobaculum stercoricanis]
MKKQLWSAAACAMMILAGCSSASNGSSTASNASADSDTFTVGMECNYAPFNWQQVEGSDTAVELGGGAGYCDGYDVMISQDIAENLGKKLVVKKINWDGLQPALDSGEIDAIVAGMTANEEREEGIDFTTPYFSSEMVLIVPKGSELESFTDIQQFSGHKVIGQKNTNYDTVIDQIEGVNHVVPKSAYPELVLALQTGEAEAITAELPVAKGICEANPDLTYITFEEGKGFDIDTAVSIGLKNNSRDSEEFNAVQEALDKITQETREEYMQNAVNNAPTNE